MCGFPLFSLVSPCYYSLITNRVGITSEGCNRAVIIWGTNDKSGRATFCSTLCGVVLLQQISIKCDASHRNRPHHKRGCNV